MITKYLALTTILTVGYASAEFRTWTRDDGKTANLNLTATKSEGDVLKGVFKMRNGQSVELAAADLSEEDAALVEAFQTSKLEEEATELAAVASVSVFDEILDGNLEKLEKKSLRRYELESKPTKYYLFYYTASWCPPCRKFTPSLVDFYEQNKPTSDEFEIILITSDRDDDAMEDYAFEKKMNWPHLKISKVEEFKKEFQHPGGGIPNLVLTDLEGNLIKTSYNDGKYIGPTPVMKHLEELIN